VDSFFTCTYVYHLIRSSLSRQQGMPSKASPWEHHTAVPEDTTPSEESMAPRTLFLLRNPLPWGYASYREYRHPKINSSHSKQGNHINQPPWYSPTFMEFVTPLSHLIFQTL